MKITKAVIPVAGSGVRLHPITKVIPKTMIPIGNKPVLQYIIEEGIEAGIKEFIIIINENQQMIRDYFNTEFDVIKSKDILELNNLVRELKLSFVIQPQQKGLADALLYVENIIGDDDFALMLGDDLIMHSNKSYGISNLINIYNKTKSYVVGVRKVNRNKLKDYGIVTYDKNHNLIHIVEKPETNPPSKLAVIGRYIIKNDIFKYIKKCNTNSEILLTDVLNDITNNHVIRIYNIKDHCFDIGNVLGYLEASSYIKKKNKG